MCNEEFDSISNLLMHVWAVPKAATPAPQWSISKNAPKNTANANRTKAPQAIGLMTSE